MFPGRGAMNVGAVGASVGFEAENLGLEGADPAVSQQLVEGADTWPGYTAGPSVVANWAASEPE